MSSLKIAHLKRRAEEELKRGNYGHAADRYSEAIQALLPVPQPPTAPAAALLQQQHPPRGVPTPELRALLSNRSLALLKAGKAAAAAEDAAAAVRLSPCWHKGHWRLAKALCRLGRWSNALDCFARAWALSEPGSTEQEECEQQLVSVLQKLTRQELADRLLSALATQQQQQQQQALSLAGTDGTTSALGAAATVTPAVQLAPAAAAELLSACQPQELSEALFQLVKAAQQQQQHSTTSRVPLHRMQALLLKWLLLTVNTSTDAASSVKSRARGSAYLHSSILPVVLDLELQLLTAQLAVKVKRWGVATAVTEALQQKLTKLALPDESVLLQLLVDCHICLGEAAWADGPSSSSSGSDVHWITAQPTASTAPPGSSVQFCHPYKAAAACLTALDLLPMTHRPAASSGSSGASGGCGGSSKGRMSFLQLLLRSGGPLAAESTTAAASAAATAAAAAASTAAAAAGQLRRDIQRRLDAALEQLSDLEQAAVWASTAAAMSSSNTASKSQSQEQQQQAAGATAACTTAADGRQLAEAGVTAAPASSSSGVSGLELACLQVGMQQVDGEMFHKVSTLPPALLVTVTIQANSTTPTNSSSSSVSSSSVSSSSSSIAATTTTNSSSSSVARGLSGAARVALLRGVARAAGVGKLAVGLGQIKLPAAPASQAAAAVTAAAATAGGKAVGVNKLQSVTFKVQFGADATAAARFAALCSSGMEPLLSACPELAAALVGSELSYVTASFQAELQQHGSMSSSSSSSAAGVASAAAGQQASVTTALQLYRVASVGVIDLTTAAAAAAGHGGAGGAGGGGGGAYDEAATHNQLSSTVTGWCQQPPAAAAATSKAVTTLAAVGNDSSSSSSRDMSAVTAEAAGPAASAVIPLPYAHYRLVGQDGRALERPDKHPFALSRVLYDVRELPGSESEVWFESRDGAYRWRQTASSVLLQLHALPDNITAAKQLSVSIEPYALRVQEKGNPPGKNQMVPPRGESVVKPRQDSDVAPRGDFESDADPQPGQPGQPGQGLGHVDGLNLAQGEGSMGPPPVGVVLGQVCQPVGELLFEAELARAIVPEDSTWVFVRPEQQQQRRAAAAAAAAAAPGGGSCGDGSVAAAVAALVPNANGGNSSSNSGCHVLFELTKMNLELYESPHQHSASWWPRLFADDPTDVAWDDAPKDYSDLPPAIAAAAAAEAAREDVFRRQQEDRRAASDKLNALVDRHMEYRWQRLRELKAAAWNTASSTAGSRGRRHQMGAHRQPRDSSSSGGSSAG